MNRNEWMEFTRINLWGFITGCWLVVLIPFVGLLSLLDYLRRKVTDFAMRETMATFIIGSVVSLLVLGWGVSFVSERQRSVKAEYERDSLSYELSKFTQMYDNQNE